jgi:hypothetical protein
MAYKLTVEAQKGWRKITAPHLIPLVQAGVPFKDGKRVPESPDVQSLRNLVESMHELQQEEALVGNAA